MQDVEANELAGRYSLQEGIDLLLAGTGLNPTFSNHVVLSIAADESSADEGEDMEADKKVGFLAALAAAFSTNVDAQDVEAEGADVLDVIVVTAQRRDENIQDVPMSVAVLDLNEFVGVGLTDLQSVVAYTPGITVSNTLGTPSGANFTVRGLGQRRGTSTVGVYVDTIPTTSNTPYAGGIIAALDGLLLDIEQVEVLKGPQGTLYGATSIGGAVKYVTRKPSLIEFRGRLSADLSTTKDGGDVNQLYSGQISAPLVEDRVGIALAGFWLDNAGLVDRVDGTTGAVLLENADSFEEYGVSGDIYAKISDTISFRGRIFHQESEYDGRAQVTLDPATRRPLNGSLSNSEGVRSTEDSSTLYSGVLNFEFDSATLTSTTSYYEQRSFQIADAIQFGALYDTLLGRPVGTTTSAPQKSDSFYELLTQEFQLASNADGQWTWLAGLFFSEEDGENAASTRVQPGDLNIASFGSPSDYREYAAYGNISFVLTPKFDVTVGGRVSSHEMEYSPTGTSSDIPFLISSGTNNKTDAVVDTWSLSGRYRPHDDLTLYGRIASGYRPAFANAPRTDGVVSLPVEVDADTVWSYELGLKGGSPNGAINYDMALWYSTWSDFQTVATLSPIVSGFVNVDGGVTAKGVEGSISVLAFDGFSFFANAAYTDSSLNDDEPTLNGLAGQQLPYVPDWTLSSRAQYEFAIAANVDAHVSAGLRYESESRSDFDNGNPGNAVVNFPTDSYVALDIGAGVSFGAVALNAYVTNALDEEAYLSTAGAFGNFSGVPLRPRTVGASVKISF